MAIDYSLIDPAVRDRALSPLRGDQSEGFFGEMAKGLDSGTTGIHGGLRAMAGTAADALGYDQFAQSQYERARQLQAQAQTEAPRITSYKQVLDDPSFRNLRDYTGGLLGGSIPSVGAGLAGSLLGGGGAVGMLAGTLAQSPIEASDVAMKQLNDPAAMQMAPGERFGRQLAGGVGSSALQSVVPNWIGGKLLGRGAETAAKQTVGQIIGRNAMAVPSEGFFEGASDALKQTASNDQQPLDWESITENVVGGGVAGGALSGVGTVGDLATRNYPMARNAIGSAYDAAQAKLGEKLTQGKKLAGEKMDQAGESDTWKFVEDIADTGSKMASGLWDAASELGQAMSPKVQAKGEEVAAWLKESAEKQTADIQSWVKEVSASEDVPAELKKRFVSAAKATPEKLNKAWLASVGYAVAATKAAKKGVDHVAKIKDSFKPVEDVVDQAEVLKNEQLGADGQKLNDDNAVKKAVSKANELLASGKTLATDGLTSIEEALKNVQNPTMRKIIDEAHKAWKWGVQQVEDLKELGAKEYEARWPKAADEGTKKSEDRSGTRKVINEVLVPWIRKNSPQTLDPDMAEGASKGDAGYRPSGLMSLNALGGLFNRVMDHSYRHPDKSLPNDVKYKLFNVFGQDTDSILSQMHDALGTTDAPFVKAHYESMAKLAEDRQQYKRFVNMVDDLRVNRAADPRKIAANLMEWATKDDGQEKNLFSDETANARTKLEALRVNEILSDEFGENAPKILAALESETKRQRDRYMAPVEQQAKDAYDDEVEDGEPDGEDWAPPKTEMATDTVRYGQGQRKETAKIAVMKPSLFEHRKQLELKNEFRDKTQDQYQGRNYGDKAMRLAERTHNPDPNNKRWTVEWKSEHELGVGSRKDHGFIVASKTTTKDTFTDADYAAMHFDTQNYGGKKGENKARIELPAKMDEEGNEIDKRILDATKLERVGQAHMSRHGEERTVHGVAAKNKAIAHAVAQLMMEYPTFKMPDDAIVRYVDGKPVTFGEIKDIGQTTVESADSRTEQELKKQIAAGEVVMHKAIYDAILKGRPEGQQPAPDNEIHAPELEMNYKDGQQVKGKTLTMRPEFAGKSTVDLILSGDRKATTGGLARFKGYGKGDIVNAIGGDGKSALIRFTTDPYPINKITPQAWSKLEGWSPAVYDMYEGAYQAQFELVPDSKKATIGMFSNGAFAKLHPQERPIALEMARSKDWREWAGLTKLDAKLARVQDRISQRSDGAYGRDVDNGRAEDLDDPQDYDKTGNIHDLERRVGQGYNNEHLVKVNVDETPRYTPVRPRLGLGKDKKGFEGNLGHRITQAVADKANELIARGDNRAYEFDNDGYVATKGEIPANPNKPKSPVQRKVGFVLPVVNKHTAKDQRKADKATAYIGVGSAKSATNIYAEAAIAQGIPVNGVVAWTPNLDLPTGYSKGGAPVRDDQRATEPAKMVGYTAKDVVFISAEGRRSGRISPDFAEIQRAMDAKATLITDIALHRNTSFNIGEQQVADYLEDHGYTEGAPGRWIPSPDFKESTKNLGPMNVDQANELSAFSLGHMMKDMADYVAAKQAEARATGQEPAGMPSKADMLRLGAAAAPGVPGHTIEHLIWPVVSKYMPDYVLKVADGAGATPKGGSPGSSGKETAPSAPRRPVPASAQSQPSDADRRAEPIEPDNLPMRAKSDLPTSPRRAPSPKVIAAKKAALLEKAASGNQALLDELSTSTDAKGLQRAAEALLGAPGTDGALDTIQQRMGGLLQDDSTAYGMQTRRYSLESTRIHEDLGREGFAATHDSPIRHEGKFDWRAHLGKGEGHAAFGAGVNVSTADGVHKTYKNQFTAGSWDKGDRGVGGVWVTRAIAENPHLRGEALRKKALSLVSEEADRDFAAIARHDITTAPLGAFSGPSPTYHLSINIKPEEMLDWNKPLSEQSELVKKALGLVWDDLRYGSFTVKRTKLMSGTVLYRAFKDGNNLTLKESRDLDEAKAFVEREANKETGASVYTDLSDKLGSQTAASNYLQSLGILGHWFNAAGGWQEKYRNAIIYDDSKITTNYVHFSQQAAGPGPNVNPDSFDRAREYLDRATPWVRQQLADLMHAGDYTETANLIRLSKNALNPQSTAYHESLHAFFADLRKNGRADVIAVLQTMADSPSIRMQMRDFFANEIGVLRQLNADPEERAAVMYQMWALGKLKVGPKAQGLFARIKEFFAKLLGHWTNEEHALHIMDYLNSGKYADNRSDLNVVYKAMMATGREQAWAQTKQFAKPLADMANSIIGAGSENLRDTGNKALIELADKVKKRLTDEGRDAGYIAASREAYTGYMNRLGALVEGADAGTMSMALRALQTGTAATSPKSEAIRVGVRKLLDEMHQYLVKAGVDVQDLGVGKDYFPRHWDADYLSRNHTAFMDMARKYPQWHDPEQTYRRLMGDMGAELPTVDRPGMAANKQRVLSFIAEADAAPFMEKDLLQIMNGYVSQATRRAEWARRFQDDNSGMEALLQQARAEGATSSQIEQAKKFVEGVNGTLGDDLNPDARRLMGDVIVYQNIRLLPLAIFSSIVDPMGILVRGGTIKDAWNTFKRAVSEIPKGLKGDTRADEMTRLAEDLDTITKASLQHALGTSYNQGMVGKTGQKINDTFFRFNLMEQWNTSVRVGATEAALGFLAKHAPGFNAHSARYMKELGLLAGDVKEVNGRVATTVAEGLTEEQAARVKSAVNQWVNGAVLRPDAADVAVWMNDPHFMLISHLKRFIHTFHHTILKRVYHEFKNGNYTPMIALTSYIPIMLASDMIKGVLQGGGDTPEWKKNWTAGDYFMNAAERAGVFGVGQYGIEAMHGNWGALTGPTFEQITDAVSVMGGRESLRSFALHAMPANALYATWAKSGKNDTFDNPE